jgi:NADH dehydrogenase
MPLAKLTTRLVSLAMPLPVDETTLTMLEEENVARGTTAAGILGIEATALDPGLRMLADSLQETLPEEGVGSLEHKRFWADIGGSRHSAAALMTMFRERVNDFMPIEFVAEPGAAQRVEKGATLTGALPVRGNFQVRVEVAEPRHVVFATIEGHPLAGIVEFTTSDVDGGIRFAIDTWTRPSNVMDWFGVRTIGAPAQDANWRAVVQRVVAASGGTSEGVQQEKKKLSEEEAAAVEKRVRAMVQERKREEAEASASEGAP